LTKQAEKYSVWLNGQPAEQLSLQDRSIQYGDGFFTTLKVVNNQIYNWQSHWRRIENSCQRLKMSEVNQAVLLANLAEALACYSAEHSHESCMVKILFSRGEGGAGYQMPEQMNINTVFYIKPVNSSKVSDLKVGLCKTMASVTSFAGVKTLNRLENVLARTEVAEQGFDEGVMLDDQGQVICGTQSNLYIIKNDVIQTPIIDRSGVEGTCRYQLNQWLVQQGMQLEESRLTLDDLNKADELFFTNAVRGVQTAQSFNDADYSQSTGLQLQAGWEKWQCDNATDITRI